MLKKTPLNEVHKKLGATLVDFGGWEMPVQYTNVIDEHTTTRTKVGLFDICHMGEFEISGQDAEQFLQKILTNDVSSLDINQARYTAMCNEQGGIIDDLFVYKLKDKFLLVVNAGTVSKDFLWLEKNIDGDVNIVNITEETAKLDIQGPESEKALQKLTEFKISELKRFNCEEIELKGVKTLISRSGYTGEDGFEIYFNAEKAEEMWNAIMESGAEFGIKPIGLGARDTLRIEAGYSLYGHEIDENITPIEASLSFIVKFTKNFIGKEILEKQKSEGTEKELICFELIDRGIPREKYVIKDNEKEIGYVTSGTFSPTFKKGIGMGYILKDLKKIGDEVQVIIRHKPYKAKIVKKPFYEYNGKIK